MGNEACCRAGASKAQLAMQKQSGVYRDARSGHSRAEATWSRRVGVCWCRTGMSQVHGDLGEQEISLGWCGRARAREKGSPAVGHARRCVMSGLDVRGLLACMVAGWAGCKEGKDPDAVTSKS